MQRTKQLLPLGEKTVIAHCAEGLINAGIGDIVVVTGKKHKSIQKALDDFPVRFAVNPHPESEMADSVRTGLGEISHSSTGILICLSDHPLISSETFRSLAFMHEKMPDKIIVPIHKGKRGHPTLFPAGVIKEIFSAVSLREVIRQNSGKTFFAEMPDEGVVMDMDTTEDYEKIIDKLGKKLHTVFFKNRL